MDPVLENIEDQVATPSVESIPNNYESPPNILLMGGIPLIEGFLHYTSQPENLALLGVITAATYAYVLYARSRRSQGGQPEVHPPAEGWLKFPRLVGLRNAVDRSDPIFDTYQEVLKLPHVQAAHDLSASLRTDYQGKKALLAPEVFGAFSMIEGEVTARKEQEALSGRHSPHWLDNIVNKSKKQLTVKVPMAASSPEKLKKAKRLIKNEYKRSDWPHTYFDWHSFSYGGGNRVPPHRQEARITFFASAQDKKDFMRNIR